MKMKSIIAMVFIPSLMLHSYTNARGMIVDKNGYSNTHGKEKLSCTTLKICALTDRSKAMSERVYVSEEMYSKLLKEAYTDQQLGLHKNVYVSIEHKGKTTYGLLGCDKSASNDQVYLSSRFRNFLSVALDETISISVIKDQSEVFTPINIADINVSVFSKGKDVRLDNEELSADVLKSLMGMPINVGQKFLVNHKSIILVLEIEGLSSVNADKAKFNSKKFGILTSENIEISFKSCCDQLKIDSKKQDDEFREIFSTEYNFEEMGIGGLDSTAADLFKKVLASRCAPLNLRKKFGVNNVKGVILYGPPGTGKTLIARQLSKLIKTGIEPKIISGPEIFNKYVGESEKAIRELFKDAEDEYKREGERSNIHVIIFDELDCICKSRSISSNASAGVTNSVVTQLLAKMDGVESLDNILIIGMTNRIQDLDEAFLRPGRFELKLKVSLPDKKGREQIFRIHLRHAKENGVLAKDVDINRLAELSDNFTGAEIAGAVRYACSDVLDRVIAKRNSSESTEYKWEQDPDVKIRMRNLEDAIKEITPQHGRSDNILDSQMFGIIDFCPEIEKLKKSLNECLDVFSKSRIQNKFSMLICGEPGSGVTSLSAYFANNPVFPFARLVNVSDLGVSDEQICMNIKLLMQEAYTGQSSVIVIDGIEDVIKFSSSGHSINVLPIIRNLLSSVPPHGKKLAVIFTTHCKDDLYKRKILDNNSFDVIFNMPLIDSSRSAQLVIEALGINIDEDDKSNEMFKNKCNDVLSQRGFAIKKFATIIDRISYSTDESFKWYDLFTVLEEQVG